MVSKSDSSNPIETDAGTQTNADHMIIISMSADQCYALGGNIMPERPLQCSPTVFFQLHREHL